MRVSHPISGRARRLGFAAAALSSAVLAMAGTCVPKVAPPPPGPGSGLPEQGRFIWHELLTVDRAASQKFYSELFGWTFHEAGNVRKDYALIQEGFDRIGGIMQTTRRQEGGPGSQWLSYIDVANVDEVTAKFKKSGATVEVEPQEIANGVARASVVTDSQGALVGLLRFHRVLPMEERPGRVNRWLWAEYIAQDPAASIAQLRDAIGFRDETRVDSGFTYYVLSTDKPRAGMFKSPWENVRPNWLPYIRVEDPAAVAQKAVQMGGTMVLAPRPDVRKGTLAIILDPVGAAVALQKWPM